VYITFLRDPVYRYLSEFKHVQRGATWKNVRLKCNGKSAAGTVVPPCYTGKSYSFTTFIFFKAVGTFICLSLVLMQLCCPHGIPVLVYASSSMGGPYYGVEKQ